MALTGGIATGKSHCLRRFAELGASVIDADAVAHALVEPGHPALDEILTRFGPGVRTPAGALDRAALGRVVFADASARRDLEAILHPRVYGAITSWFDGLAHTDAPPPLGVADIPLLFETGHERDFDVIVVAACPLAQQVARGVARDGLSEDDARQRIAAQLPLADKISRAHYVIDTSGTTAETDARVADVWRELTAVAARRPR